MSETDLASVALDGPLATRKSVQIHPLVHGVLKRHSKARRLKLQRLLDQILTDWLIEHPLADEQSEVS